MNEYILKIYPRAFQDLEDILDYISEDLKNKSAALRLAEKFEEIFETLCRFPLSYPLSRNEAVAKKGLRKAVLEKYLIFYYADEEKRQIEVVHIACGYRDYYELL